MSLFKNNSSGQQGRGLFSGNGNQNRPSLFTSENPHPSSNTSLFNPNNQSQHQEGHPLSQQSQQVSIPKKGGFHYEANKVWFMDELLATMEKCKLIIPQNLLDETDFPDAVFELLDKYNIQIPTENLTKFRKGQQSTSSNAQNAILQPTQQIPAQNTHSEPQLTPTTSQNQVPVTSPIQNNQRSDGQGTQQPANQNNENTKIASSFFTSTKPVENVSLFGGKKEEKQAPTQPTGSSSLFGNSSPTQTNQQPQLEPKTEQPKPSLFPNTSTTQTNKSPENTNSGGSILSLFSNKNLDPTEPSTSLFAKPTQTSQPQTTQSRGGLFDNPSGLKPQTTSTGTTQGSLFSKPTRSLFDNPNSSPTQTQQTQQTQGGGLFGGSRPVSTQPSGGSLFGNTGLSGSSLFGNPSNTQFQAQPNQSNNAGKLFGGSQQTSNNLLNIENAGVSGGGLFGQQGGGNSLFGSLKPGGLFGSVSGSTQTDTTKEPKIKAKPFLSEEELLELLKPKPRFPEITEKYNDDEEIAEVKAESVYKFEDNVTLEIFSDPIKKITDSQHATFVISVHGKPLNGARFLPMDVVFLVDTSGSMKNGRMDQIKAGIKATLPHFSGKDRVSIVGFAEEAKRYCRLVKSTSDEITQALDMLEPEGTTNIEKGMVHAFEVLAQRQKKNPINAIILISDGMDFLPRDYRECFAHYKKKINDAIILNTIGFGEHHDPLQCIPIAGITQGEYYPCEQIEQLGDKLTECVNSLKRIVAKSPRIEFYSNNPAIDFSRVEKDLWKAKEDDDNLMSSTIYTQGQYLFAGTTHDYAVHVNLKLDSENLQLPTILAGIVSLKAKTLLGGDDLSTFSDAKLSFTARETNEEEKNKYARTFKKSIEDDLLKASEFALCYNMSEGKKIIDEILNQVKGYRDQENPIIKELAKDIEDIGSNWDQFKFYKTARYIIARHIRKEYILE